MLDEIRRKVLHFEPKLWASMFVNIVHSLLTLLIPLANIASGNLSFRLVKHDRIEVSPSSTCKSSKFCGLELRTSNRMIIKLALLLLGCWHVMVDAKPQPPEIKTLELVLSWSPTEIKKRALLSRYRSARLAIHNYDKYLNWYGGHLFVVHGLWASGEIHTRIDHINSGYYDCSDATDSSVFEPTQNPEENNKRNRIIEDIKSLPEIGRYWPGIFYRNRTDAYKYQWVRPFRFIW